MTRLYDVRRKIEDACERSGRDISSVTLVAASKTVPAEVIADTIKDGQLVFGENRVQEGKEKWPAIGEQHPDVELHLIGPLQSNKVRDAVGLFDVIQSVDRESLCKALARECQKQGRGPRIFVQVNIGEESQKSGVLPAQATDLVDSCRGSYELDVAGLMCIPPAGASAEPYFRHLSTLAADSGVSALSMGMSSDFGKAIECGATHVRVGSAIFGART